MSASLAPSSVCFSILSHSYRSSTLIKTKDFHSSWEWSSTKADCTSQVCSETHQQVVRWNLHVTPLHPSHSVLSSLHALSAHSGSPSAHDGNSRETGDHHLLKGFYLSGHSLVEEGKQVAHHHQRRPRDPQQDLADALRPLVHVLYPCSEKAARVTRFFIGQHIWTRGCNL